MVQLFFSNMNDAKEVERRTGAEFVHHKIRLMQAKDLHLSETFEGAFKEERLEAGAGVLEDFGAEGCSG